MGYDIVSLIPAFCAAFLGLSEFEGGGIVVWDQIDLATYDYSVASLEQVDLYLDAVREVKDQLEWQTYTNTVLATGAYIGEVIRRHGDKHWEWMNYADFAAKYPKLNSAMGMKEDLYSAAVLVGDGRTAIVPFNKVMRNLEEGPENNIHFYVTALGAGDSQ